MRNARYTSSTSRPKKPKTGHAPISRNVTPAAKLIDPIKAIRIKKPAALSDRYGVRIAENNVGSAAMSLREVIAFHYTSIMARNTTPQKPAGKGAARPGGPPSAARKGAKPKPWTP